MALQLERAIVRRAMIQGLPITMILFYCTKTATQPFSTLPTLAPSIAFPHWLARLLSIVKVAPRFSCLPRSASCSLLGVLSRAKETVERVQCPLENVLLQTLTGALKLSFFGWGLGD